MSIAVIIPSKAIENLLPCVRAIEKHDPGIRIIVIDDGIDVRDRTYLNCIFIDGQKPFVFSRNVNLGLEYALKGVTEHFSDGRWTERLPRYDGAVLLNDDALLQTPGGFSLLAQAAAEHPEFGIIAATTNVVGNPNQFNKGIGLREEPRMACFVCVYIPRRTIEAVGLLDERFGVGGFEDDDYCLRVRRAGLKIGIHDGCYVDHGSLVSTIRGPGGPGYTPNGAEIFREKWGAGNHEL